MSIRARKKKDGTTVYDATLDYGIVSGQRLRETRTFATRHDAETAEQDAKRYRDAANRKQGSMTLAQYIDFHYWPIASRRLAATSLDTYSREIHLRIRPNLGHLRLDAIDRRAIQRMVDSCASDSVARKSVSLLKTILNEAVGDGYITGNPASAKYAFPRKKGKRDNGLILTDFEQIASFIETVQNDAPESITRLVMAGLMLGLRPEERYALDYEDFDFSAGTVSIHQAFVTASARYGGNQLKETKTELSARVIPMPQPFIDWFYWQDNGTGAWITNRAGERLSPSTAQKMWRRYLEAHPDLPPVTLENMRHSFATSCLHAGMNIEDVSRMLGHSNINTTFNRYIKPDFLNVRSALQAIPYPD